MHVVNSCFFPPRGKKKEREKEKIIKKGVRRISMMAARNKEGKYIRTKQGSEGRNRVGCGAEREMAEE